MTNPELEGYTTEQLANEVSDFYKDLFGCRPEFQNVFDRNELIRLYNFCSEYLSNMSPEQLESEGWF